MRGFLHPGGCQGDAAGKELPPLVAPGPPPCRGCCAPASAPQEGSSNSPASDRKGETYCCFPQLAKYRLIRCHANAPACYPVQKLQPPPGLQEGGRGGNPEPQEEPEPLLMEVGGKAAGEVGAPAAARPGAAVRLGAAMRRVPQGDDFPQAHSTPPRRCQVGLGGCAVEWRGGSRWDAGARRGRRRWARAEGSGGSLSSTLHTRSVPRHQRELELAMALPGALSALNTKKGWKTAWEGTAKGPPFWRCWGAVPSLGAFQCPWHVPGLVPSPSESRSCLVAWLLLHICFVLSLIHPKWGCCHSQDSPPLAL